MLMPPISRHMTAQPWTIRRDATLTQARDIMREHRVRHLPVLEAGKLVGILSERDVLLLERYRQFDEEWTVEDAMTADVYTANANDPTDAVVEQMAEHKYGCAVIVGPRNAVEGIFTMVDGMQILADVLRRAVA